MQAQSSSDGKVYGVGERDRVNPGDPDDDRLAQLDLYVDGVTSDARNPPNREAQGGLNLGRTKRTRAVSGGAASDVVENGRSWAEPFASDPVLGEHRV